MFTLWHVTLNLSLKSEFEGNCSSTALYITALEFFWCFQSQDTFLLRPQSQTQTWEHGHSEACAVVQHTFDLLDYTNMLINQGTHSCHDRYTFAPSDLLNGKHCNMFIVKSASVNITSHMMGQT